MGTSKSCLLGHAALFANLSLASLCLHTTLGQGVAQHELPWVQVQISQLQAQNQHLQEQVADMTAALLDHQEPPRPPSPRSEAGQAPQPRREVNASPALQSSTGTSMQEGAPKNSSRSRSSRQLQGSGSGVSASTQLPTSNGRGVGSGEAGWPRGGRPVRDRPQSGAADAGEARLSAAASSLPGYGAAKGGLRWGGGSSPQGAARSAAEGLTGRAASALRQAQQVCTPPRSASRLTRQWQALLSARLLSDPDTTQIYLSYSMLRLPMHCCRSHLPLLTLMNS